MGCRSGGGRRGHRGCVGVLGCATDRASLVAYGRAAPRPVADGAARLCAHASSQPRPDRRAITRKPNTQGSLATQEFGIRVERLSLNVQALSGTAAGGAPMNSLQIYCGISKHAIGFPEASALVAAYAKQIAG